MSNTIDQRVVEMRFDNSHFESNVSTTMSTLDKLKQKLNLSGAAKGLDDINNSAKNINMSGLGNAVEAVSAKFSALQVMGVTALANITNSAVNAGKRIVKSLTIDPIQTGFNEYELKMGSIQTIMAGTGESLETVNRYLNELNKYSDDTIYSFKDMTSNIGKFTNAGVKLEDAVLAIKGISNEAAVSGANANEASRAMYNFSQALSAGFVKLIDWKSIELANMATKEFKEQLIQTAVEVGTLKKGADGMYDVANVISKANATSLNATKNFNDSLGNQWMTTEVLIGTLRKYADETTEIGAKATAAATEVKTFTMMMDTLKESAQSGWAQTWELLVGDFEESKAFFTELSGIFGDILGKSADRRNSLLSGALTSNWDKLITKIGEAGVSADKFEESVRKVVGDEKLDGLIEKYGSLDKAVKAGTISSDELKKALDGVAGTDADSKIKNIVDGLKEIKGQLKRGNVGEDVKKLQAALKALDYDLGEFGENKDGLDGRLGPVTTKAIKTFQEAHGLVVDGIAGPETLAAIEEAAGKIDGMSGDVEGLTESCESLLDVITKPSGRELLLDSLMNVIKAIQRPLEAVGEALRNTFNITPDKLYNALKGLNNFTKKLKPEGVLDAKTWGELTDGVNKLGLSTTEFELKIKDVLQSHGVDVDKLIEKYGSLGKAFEESAISFDYIEEALLGFEGISESLIKGGENADKVRRTFEGLFAIVDIVATIAAGPLKLAFKIVTDILGRLGLTVLDVTARIGDAIVKFRDNIDKVVGAISTVIVDNVTEWIEQFQETEFFKTIVGWFEDASKAISDAFDNITKRIEEFDATALIQGLETVGTFFVGLVKAAADSKIVKTILKGITSAFDKVKNFFGKFKLPEFNIDNLKKFSTDLVKIGEKIAGSGKTGFLGMLSGFGKHLKDNVLSWNWTVFKENALEKFVNFYLKSGDVIKKGFEKAREVFQAIIKFIFGTEELSLPVIMDLVTKVLWIATLWQALKTMERLTSPLDSMADSLENLSASLKWDAMAGAFKAMAIALGVFTLCIIVLTQMPDMKKAWHAVGMMVALMIVMGGVVTLMGWVAAKSHSGLDAMGATLSLLMIVGAIAILIHAIKEIDKLKLKNPGETFLILGAIILGMVGAVKMISAAGGSSFRSVASILTLLASLKLILEVIEAYDKFPWAGTHRAIERMVEMMLYLSVAIRIMSGGIKAGASASGLAFLILAMVVSLKLLLGVIEGFAAMDTAVLLKGGGVVLGILAFLTTMLATINATSNGTVLQKGERSVNNFAGLAMALLAAVAAIWLLGKMDYKTLKQGGFALGQVLILFTGMLAVLGKACSGLKIGSIVAMMIMIGVIMAETAIIIHYLDEVSWQSKISTAGSLATLLLAMAGVMWAISKVNINVNDIYGWTIALGILVGVLVGLGVVLYAMNGIDPIGAIANATALGGLLSVMAGVLHILSRLDMRKLSDKKLRTLGLVFTAMTIILFELSLVLAAMSALNTQDAIVNATALSELLVVMTWVLTALSFIKVNKGTYKAIGGIAILGLVVAELGVVLYALRDAGIGGMIDDVLVLSALLGVLTLVMAAVSAMGLFVNWKGAGVAVLGIGLLGLIIWELGGILSNLKNAGIGGMMDDVLVLSAMLGVLTLAMAAVSGLSLFVNPGGAAVAIVGIGLLGLIIWELGGILSNLKNAGIGSMMSDVLVLSTMLGVLTLVMAAVSALSLFVDPTGAAVAIVGIGLLGLIVWGLGGVLATLKSVEIGGMISDVTVLSAMLLVLTGVMAAVAVLGWICNPYGMGIALVAMLALEVILLALVGVLAVLKAAKIGGMMQDVKVLSTMLLVLVGVMAALSILGFVAPAAIAGVSAFTYLVSCLTGLVLAIGGLAALMDAIGILDPVIKALKKLAKGVGEIISDFGVGLTSGLPEIGTNMSDFATNLQTFITTMKTVDTSVIDNAKTLAKAILALTAGDFLDAITGLFNGREDGSSLGALGTNLSTFGKNVGDFITAMNGIDPEAAVGIEAFATAVEKFIGLSALDMLVWTDTKDGFAQFGEKIAAFAGSMKAAAAELSDFSEDDLAAIKRATAAAEAVADLNASLQRSDGLWQKIAGEKNLATWGEKIVEFAESLIAYSNKVSGKNIDAAAIETSAAAAQKLADLNETLPAFGGFTQAITGVKDIETWAVKIDRFGKFLAQYSATVSEEGAIDAKAIEYSTKAASHLVKLNDTLPAMGGLINFFKGEADMETFGNGLLALADGLAQYTKRSKEIEEIGTEAIPKTKEVLTAILEVVKLVPGINELFSFDDINDIGEFGLGLTNLTTGMSGFTKLAATFDEADVTAMDNAKLVVEKLIEVLEAIDIDDLDYMDWTTLNNAAVKLQESLAILGQMNTTEFDFSGIEAFKTKVNEVLALFFSEGNAVDLTAFSISATNLQTGITNLTSAATSLTSINDNTYGGVDVLINALERLAEAKVQETIDAFSGKAGDIENSVGSVVTALANSLKDTGPVNEAAEALAKSAVSSLENTDDKFFKAGKKLATSLRDGLKDRASMVGEQGGLLSRAARNSASSKGNIEEMKSAGKDLGAGLVAGIKAKWQAAYDAGYTLGQKAVQGEKDGQKSNSPSKLTIQAGKWLGEGLVIGMEKMGNAVYSAGKTLGRDAVGSISNSIRKISSLVESDIDTQPTIRPVLDLSDVRAGVGTLNGMMNLGSTLGVSTNVGAISSMMNRRGQNGVNDEVVSAINKLRKDLGNIGSTTYQINGVTYDDGSNISDAVKTIVRAARIERRV